ncbi:MAG: amino acid ABC transporter permease [Propionicimonas sp.]|uniref:amino acid ABC transporter permease n=1 Tax=Propionicimonas sp. TaxID=1955623 RepID=UPI002B204138|nr:amino acid ABC transporter permease [Propionicimonas sp.]MEA4944692.1 amino acid ABC transporter permease [Propionicimonas sp.]
MSVLPYLKPTTRKRLGRSASYVVAVVVLLVIALLVDWQQIQQQFLNPEYALQMWPAILTTALKNTLIYTISSFILGSILAVLLAIMKLGGGPLGWFASAFIELFRGIPALLTIFTAAYVLPIAFNGFQIPGGGPGAGIVALTIVTGAYAAEIVRAGIQAVPVGQTEAARSLGMGAGQTTFWVVLPQAMRIVIPPMTNEFVMLLKDTSLLFAAGFAVTEKELTTFGQDALSTTGNATPIVMVAAAYLIVTLPLTWLVGKLEKKLDPKR